MKKKLFLRAAGDTVPVLAGYVVLGAGFGILLNELGYGAGWAFFMSFCIYAGSMQYMALSLLSSGASLPVFALTTLMVNARHLFYGISMVEKYRGTGLKKPYLIFALTDETYSLVCADPEGVEEDGFDTYRFFVSLLDHFYWTAGSVLGSFIGSLLTFDTTGIDFALTALFITVFTDQLLKGGNAFSGITGAGVSVLCLLIFGADSFLIPAMLGITAVLLLAKRSKKEVPALG